MLLLPPEEGEPTTTIVSLGDSVGKRVVGAPDEGAMVGTRVILDGL